MRQLSGGARAALIAAAGLSWLVFYAAWLVFQPGGEDALRVFADTAYLVPLTTAGALSVFAWIRVPAPLKPFWRLIAVGTLFWLAADTAWCARDLVSGSVPYPWWSDAGYIASYGFLFCAVYTAFRPRFRTVGAARLLEGAVVVSCLGAAWWWVLLRPLGFDLSLGTLTNLAYGASGLALIGLLVTVRLLPARQGTLGMRLVALGITCGVAADALYVYASETEGYLTGALTELGWEAQGVFLTVAAYVGASGIGRSRDWMAFREWPRLATPLLAAMVIGTAGVLLATEDRAGSITPGLVIALAIPTVLVGLRAALDRTPSRMRVHGGSAAALGEQVRHLVARGRHFAEPFALAVALPDKPVDASLLARFRPERDVDALARLEDGRLALLLTRADAETAQALADDARERAASLDVTFSVGVATWAPGDDPAQLVALAGAAASRARVLGGNQVSTTGGDPDLESLLALAELVEAREHVPAGHSRAVAELATDLARALGIEDAAVQQIYLAGYLHDVGKVRLPASVFAQERPLDARQRSALHLHAERGAEIVARVASLHAVAPIVAAHHERIDGTGYPTGSSGDAIPLAARIVGVADSLVSMTEDRPYRAALSETHALTALWQQAGRRYDREAVAAVLRLSSERTPLLTDRQLREPRADGRRELESMPRAR